MRTRSIIAAVVALVLSVSTLVAVGLASSGRSSAESRYDALVRSCFPLDDVYISVWQNGVESCVTEWLGEVRGVEETVAAVNLLSRIALDRPSLGDNWCHSIEHSLGEQLGRTEPDNAAAAFGGKEKFSCANGFVHGLFSGLGRAGVTNEEYQAALRVCAARAAERLEARPDEENACADGGGHGLWILAPFEMARTAPLCLAFQTTIMVEQCASGILMQASSPAIGLPDIANEDLTSFAVPVCRELLGVDARLAAGCHGGIGYNVSRAGGILFEEYYNRNPTGTRVDERTLTALNELPSRYERECAKADPTGVNDCMRTAARAATGAMVQDPGYVQYCQMFGRQEYIDVCLSSR